jgi:SAM-dependent methyltransferase
MYRGTGKKALEAKHDSMAQLWDATWGHAEIGRHDFSETENWEWLKKYLPPPARVLEGGCGKGQWVRSLAELGYEAYGIDFAAETIERSHKQWPHLYLAVGDLRAMMFKDASFDGIISLGAVEHDKDGPQAALMEMNRVLKPGGLLYCTVPCINRIHSMGFLCVMNWIICNPIIRRATGRHPEVEFFEYRYQPEEYEEILRSAGFEVIEIVPLSPHCEWRKGMLRSRLVDFMHRRNPFMS